MAKDNGKEQAAETPKKAGKAKGKRASMGMKGNLLMVVAILVGVIFLPTSMILFIGMLPTVSAFFFGRRGGIRISTLTAVNLLGCMPFVIKLWSGENTFEYSVMILTSPLTIVVIYGAAVGAYILDWVVTGVVSAYMYQKAERRIRVIEKRQEAMVEVWGKEVMSFK